MITIKNKFDKVIFTNEYIEEPKTKSVRTSRSKVLSNNAIFEEMLPFAGKDEYWISIITNWRDGRYLRKFKYRNGLMIYSGMPSVKTQFEEMLDLSNPAKSFEIFKTFISKHNKVVSSTDRTRNNMLAKEYYDTEEYNQKMLSWQSVVNDKSNRIRIFKQYVDEQTDLLKLNPEQALQLLDCLKLKILSGDSSSNTFNYKNGSIIDVRGIDFVNNNKFICYPKKSKSSRTCDSESIASSRHTDVTSALASTAKFEPTHQKWSDLLSKRSLKYNKKTNSNKLTSEMLAKINKQ